MLDAGDTREAVEALADAQTARLLSLITGRGR